MAITKNSLDYSDFSSTLQANKLRGNAIRKTYEYDRYAGRDSFIAMVLTTPVLLTAGETQVEVGTPTPTLPPENTRTGARAGPSVGAQSSTKKIGKFAFRARIVGPDSPHGFIPNPCDSLEFTKATLGDKYNETRDKLIAMHTTFYTTDDFSINPGAALPTEGDYVEVFLSKGDHGFDLQKGAYRNTIVNKNDVKQTGANLGIAWDMRGASQSAFKKDPVKTGETPLELLGTAGMPFSGSFRETSAWGGPGSIRCIGSRCRRHGGADFAVPSGTEILAVADGKVTQSDFATNKEGKTKGLGGRITIAHTEKSYTKDPKKTVFSKYGHLKELKAGVNAEVKQGDVIGISGGALTDKGHGSSTGAHLHMEIWIGSSWHGGGNFHHGIGPDSADTHTEVPRTQIKKKLYKAVADIKLKKTTIAVGTEEYFEGIPNTKWAAVLDPETGEQVEKEFDQWANAGQKAPTDAYTLNFKTWLTEIQAAANIPGAFVSNSATDAPPPSQAAAAGTDAGQLDPDSDSPSARAEAEMSAITKDMEEKGETHRVTSTPT